MFEMFSSTAVFEYLSDASKIKYSQTITINNLLIFPNRFSRLCRALEECIIHRNN